MSRALWWLIGSQLFYLLSLVPSGFAALALTLLPSLVLGGAALFVAYFALSE